MGFLKHQKSMAVHELPVTSDSIDFVKLLAPLVLEEKIVSGHHQRIIKIGARYNYTTTKMSP